MFGIKPRSKQTGLVPLKPTSIASRRVFDLDQVLLSFSRQDHWTIRDACQGTQIMGGTGSGKTSGSGRAIALAFLRAGMGGIVLCAKPEERRLWQAYAREAGRENSLIVFGDDGSRRFNFLDYELRRGDRMVTHNLVSLFLRIMEVAKGREGGDGGDGFWKDAVAELLGNAFLVLYSAIGRVTLAELMSLISSAPHSEAQADRDDWRNTSFCFQAIAKMLRDPVNPLPQEDMTVAANFFRTRWPRASDKMRSSIEFTLSSLASPFLTGYLRELFCTTTNTLPEMSHEGAVLVIDLPVKQHGEAGILAQHVWKYLWQRAAERRDASSPTTRPLFLWADECQFFVAQYDGEFQSTARSSKACTVYMTQSLPVIYERIGGRNPEHSTHALLNNFQTRIFHQNGDATTNDYAADLVGRTWLTVRGHGRNAGTSRSDSLGINQSNGGSFSSGDGQMSAGSNWSSGRNRSWGKTSTKGINESYSQQVEHELLPSSFARLRQGGRGGAPQAIVVQGGRTFAHSGRPYLMCEFNQG